jgi:ferritin-like metal-binding protein YciE
LLFGGTYARRIEKAYIEELKDIYNAENQLGKALPKMAKSASSEELRMALKNTWNRRMAKCSVWKRSLKPRRISEGQEMQGHEGLVEEGSEVMQEHFEGARWTQL